MTQTSTYLGHKMVVFHMPWSIVIIVLSKQLPRVILVHDVIDKWAN